MISNWRHRVRPASELLPQIGAAFMGHRTYQGARTEEAKVYGGAWTGPQFVYTRDAPETAAPGFTFVSGDASAAVAAAKAAAGEKYVVILGASTARACLEAGVVDELLVHVAPVLLGDASGCSNSLAVRRSSSSGRDHRVKGALRASLARSKDLMPLGAVWTPEEGTQGYDPSIFEDSPEGQ